MSAISTRKYVYCQGTSFLFPRHQPYPPYLSTRFQEMLRWLEYFDALDDKVAPKVNASDFSNGPNPKWLITSWSERWSSAICLRGFNSVSQYVLWLSQCCRVLWIISNSTAEFTHGGLQLWLVNPQKMAQEKVSPAIGLLEWLKTPSWEGRKVEDWWKLPVIIANKNSFASLPSDS